MKALARVGANKPPPSRVPMQLQWCMREGESWFLNLTSPILHGLGSWWLSAIELGSGISPTSLPYGSSFWVKKPGIESNWVQQGNEKQNLPFFKSVQAPPMHPLFFVYIDISFLNRFSLKKKHAYEYNNSEMFNEINTNQTKWSTFQFL